MTQVIYTLVENGDRWHAAIGTRKKRDGSTQNALGIRQSFDTKKAAEKWLFDQGEALKIPGLPGTLRSTHTPLALGDPLPDED
jgi:hypothetical protein